MEYALITLTVGVLGVVIVFYPWIALGRIWQYSRKQSDDLHEILQLLKQHTK